MGRSAAVLTASAEELVVLVPAQDFDQAPRVTDGNH
jgi:hypothetical protein